MKLYHNSDQLNLMNAKDHFHLPRVLYFILSWLEAIFMVSKQTNNYKKVIKLNDIHTDAVSKNPAVEYGHK